MTVFRTIAAPARVEIDRIKASRFIADIAPVESVGAAKAFVDQIAAEFPDATHHCFAWRLEGDETRASDDGEPSGSAGRPILNRIIGNDLSRTIIVVTRYFGGTKLGTGGLVRAYGAAAHAALDLVEIVEREATVTITVDHSYELSGAVKSVLTQFGLKETNATYATDVRFDLVVPARVANEFVTELNERTAGRAVITPS